MRSEGYCSWSVCLSVKQHLTYGASVRPENAVTYSAGNEDQNVCGVFSETAPLQRSGTSCIVCLCAVGHFPSERANMLISTGPALRTLEAPEIVTQGEYRLPRAI